ncbi:MAG TPA: ATP-binding protein [Opitutaceae bacterium]|nr:ATP-binding protein [Opitutaceae bacterium]
MSSLTARLAAAFAIMSTLTLAAILVAGRWILDRQVVSGLDLLNQAEFEEISAEINGPSGQAVIEALTEHALLDAPMFYFQVHDAAGEILFRSQNLGANELPATRGIEPHRTEEVAELGSLRISEFPLGQQHMQIAASLGPLHALLAAYTRMSVGLVAIVAILSVAIGVAFSRIALRPIREIGRTARRIGADNLTERIPVPATRDEVADLALLLNRMFDRIESGFTEVRRFTAEASHELKTPLVLARLQAEKLARDGRLDGEQAEAMNSLLGELSRLQRVIDNLLFLAKAEAGVMQLNLREQDPQAFIAAFAEDATVLAEDRDRIFTLTGNEHGRARFDTEWIRRVLLNILTNALKFGPRGGTLLLESRVMPDAWRVTLTDDGPGVPAADLERIFSRFVQLSDSSGEENEGAGLGLAIARSILQLHGGTIRAENRTDRSGLKVTFEIPG